MMKLRGDCHNGKESEYRISGAISTGLAYSFSRRGMHMASTSHASMSCTRHVHVLVYSSLFE